MQILVRDFVFDPHNEVTGIRSMNPSFVFLHGILDTGLFLLDYPVDFIKCRHMTLSVGRNAYTAYVFASANASWDCAITLV